MADKGELVSGDRSVETPDGANLDISENIPEIVAERRGGTTVITMRGIVKEREPGILQHLYTGPGTSAEYAMSSAIIHAEQPEVKADLVRVYVQKHLDIGDHQRAIEILPLARAAELPLPEFDEKFVAGQYNTALAEGKPRQAWLIASTMVRKGGKIFKTEGEYQPSQEWKDRDSEAFKKYAEDVLSREQDTESVISGLELRTLLWVTTSREVNDDEPSELSMRIAEAVIQRDLQTPGREWAALIDAANARMPDERIAEIKRQVSPSAMDITKRLLNGVRDKAQQITGRQG
jgi:hypothetical protein